MDKAHISSNNNNKGLTEGDRENEQTPGTSLTLNQTNHEADQDNNKQLKADETQEGKQKPSQEPWEAQVGWIYSGHGEWTSGIEEKSNTRHGNVLDQEPEWIQTWLAKEDKDIVLNRKV